MKEEDSVPVGCVYVEPRGDRAYLGLLSIVPERQGAGLGKQLNIAAENFARQQGCKWMDLRVVSPRGSNCCPSIAGSVMWRRVRRSIRRS